MVFMYQKTVSSLKSNRNHRAALWLDNSKEKLCMHAETPLNETINLETWYIQIYDCWNGPPTLDILIPVLCAPDIHLPLVPQWCSSPARLFWTCLVVSCLLCFLFLYWNLLFLPKSYVSISYCCICSKICLVGGRDNNDHPLFAPNPVLSSA